MLPDRKALLKGTTGYLSISKMQKQTLKPNPMNSTPITSIDTRNLSVDKIAKARAVYAAKYPQRPPGQYSRIRACLGQRYCDGALVLRNLRLEHIGAYVDLHCAGKRVLVAQLLGRLRDVAGDCFLKLRQVVKQLVRSTTTEKVARMSSASASRSCRTVRIPISSRRATPRSAVCNLRVSPS